jgi:hypothetical protein
MKQKKIITKVFRACMDKDESQIKKLRLLEFKKIFQRKRKGKKFDAKWTVVKL